jgi:hypothetical protein
VLVVRPALDVEVLPVLLACGCCLIPDEPCREWDIGACLLRMCSCRTELKVEFTFV